MPIPLPGPRGSRGASGTTNRRPNRCLRISGCHSFRRGRPSLLKHTLSATRPVGQRGHRKIFGLDVVSADDGAGWLAFLRNLLARMPRRSAAPPWSDLPRPWLLPKPDPTTTELPVTTEALTA
jgi:hypothetical protein